MLLASNALDWYLARASGVVAYLLLTGVVVVGVAVAGKVRLRWPRFAVVDVHRFGGLLVGTFIGLHVLTLLLDRFVPFSPAQLVVPLASRYRPLPVAFGIVAMELLMAIAITNRLRSRLPYRLWRRVHYATFLVWAAATAHGLTAGTDRGTLWLSVIYVMSATAVLATTISRVARAWRRDVRLGAVVLPSLVGALVLILVIGAAPHRPSPPPPASFHGTLSGLVSGTAGHALELTSITGNASGATHHVVFRIDMLDDGVQVSATALQLRYTGVRAASCAGTVSVLDKTGFTGTCRFGNGAVQPVQASWQLAGTKLAGRLLVGQSA